MAKIKEPYGTPWTEPEFVIALYYYCRNKGKVWDETTNFINELSNVLGRTTASVVMRMENYASMEPAEIRRRKGLQHINPLGRETFQTWHRNPDGLRECAQLLLRDIDRRFPTPLFEPASAKIQKAFGKYEAYEDIAEGGFGTVRLYINVLTGQKVAIKIIRQDKVDDSEALSRFRREIKTLKTINHPNVIRIYEHNLTSRKQPLAFVMDFAECSLVDYIKSYGVRKSETERQLLEVSEAISIFKSVLDGVEALHNNHPQIVHRDINPSNILRLPDGRWVLSDFNLAKFIKNSDTRSTYRTRTNQSWGTEFYAPPEQWDDFKKADHRADIYSLGILLWGLFSPRPPSIHGLGKALPENLADVFHKATQPNPNDRFRSIAELRVAFEQALTKT